MLELMSKEGNDYMNGLMEIYTVSFFGHRHINNFRTIELQLEELIIDLLREHEYVDFLVGRNGDFDQLVSSTIRRVKRTFRDDNSCHTLVLPYETAEYRDNKESFHNYYDNIEMFGGPDVHFKAASIGRAYNQFRRRPHQVPRL